MPDTSLGYSIDPGWGWRGPPEPPRLRPLGELLPRTMPDRLEVWLYAGYGWSLEAVARLVGRHVRLVRNDLLFWRDLHRIELSLNELRATPRRGYSADLRHEVALWREKLRRERVAEARQAERNRQAILRAQDRKARPERYAYRDACILRWHRQGLRGSDIAARIGLSRERVYQKLRQLERRARRPPEPLLPLLSAAEARCMAVSLQALQGLLEERARQASLEELLEELEPPVMGPPYSEYLRAKWRKIEAARLWRGGMKQREIAQRLGVSSGRVSQLIRSALVRWPSECGA